MPPARFPPGRWTSFECLWVKAACCSCCCCRANRLLGSRRGGLNAKIRPCALPKPPSARSQRCAVRELQQIAPNPVCALAWLWHCSRPLALIPACDAACRTARMPDGCWTLSSGFAELLPPPCPTRTLGLWLVGWTVSN